MKPSIIKQALAMLTASLITSITVLLLYIWVFESEWKSYHQIVYNKHLKVSQEVEREIQQLAQLNLATEHNLTCSVSLLNKMRQTEFDLLWFRDLGFVRNNHLHCSTRLGILEQPIKLPPFDLGSKQSGIYFSESAPVIGSNSGAEEKVLLVGKYQAYLKIKTLVDNDVSWIRNATYTFDRAEKSKTSGTLDLTELSQAHSFNTLNWYAKWHFYGQSCWDKQSCAVAAVDIVGYFKYYPETLFILILFLLVFNLIALILVRSWYKGYSSLPNQLKRGINHKQVLCHYQPLKEVSSGVYSSVEVLSRWTTINKELIRPDIFIAHIQQNGQTAEFTQIVFEKTIAELKANQLWSKIRFAINVFPEDLASGFITNLVDDLLTPEQKPLLTIEVVEQEFDDMSRTIEEIKKLRARGCKVAIDDFGTGYSNFQYLELLNVDILKIDKSFVQGSEDNSLRSELIGSIVNISNTLNLLTVAEGVEKPAQFAILQQLNIDYSQGYLHAKPMPINELSSFLSPDKLANYDVKN